MIAIEDLVFHYRDSDFQLQIPEFGLNRCEKLAVIGPSGSGKTTLLNIVAGIFTAQRGKVLVNEVNLNQLGDAARRDYRITSIGFVFQDFQLLDYLDVLDNILHPYRISRALKLNRETKARAARLAAQMGIGDKLHRNVGELSQGEKQRAAICRALLPQPQLILADEATGNLDPENKSKILDLLFECVEQQQASLLAVTHDHELLTRFDRVVDFRNFRKGPA